MRLLIYARAQQAVPLYMVLKLDRPNVPICLLVGGMPKDMVEREIAKFKESPAAIMIATAAFETGWRADVEAMVLFTEDSFIRNYSTAAERVLEPTIPAPDPKELLRMIERDTKYVTGVEAVSCGLSKTLPPGTAIGMYDNALPGPYEKHYGKRREGDEYYCSDCRKRWDVQEDEPPCQD